MRNSVFGFPHLLLIIFSKKNNRRDVISALSKYKESGRRIMFIYKQRAIKILAAVGCCVLLCAGMIGCTFNSAKSDDMKLVADHLYEITVSEDFDWSTEVPLDGILACSGIQNGQYRGRNYDWYYADSDICVIHAAVAENRPHASVGVSDLSFITDDNGNVAMEKIPFITVDGINDAGVCIQVNVLPYGENGELPHTETSEDDLPGTQVVRYILDYAGSVDETVELLMDKDIYSTVGTADELHWMISGPASDTDSTIKTIVVEVFPDGLHITEKFVDDIPIMTNFNVFNFDGTAESIGWGIGYERWQILHDNASQADSVMGTFDLMEKVYFSKLYDLYSDNFWYSEYTLINLSEYYTEEELTELLGVETYNYFMENYGAVYYGPSLWDGEAEIHGDISKTGILAPVIEVDAQTYNDQSYGTDLWITVETAVYDLENLTLDISVRESQDHYHFTIETAE